MHALQGSWNFANRFHRLTRAKDIKDKDRKDRPNKQDSKRMRPGDPQDVLPSEKAGVQCCLTFDMSGGPKGAQRPLERPLDGGVSRHASL